ncbi:hypothetical protein M9H77_35450 [Catharanthus roseus]|uniref:Uncharacterized protein n=1 Tax=Catharanthus roseus TaxID=4058 RepID=A0ACB9ZPB3_CATRO|nr:hypothetical protein M9H77_35450 [Catharanthus roseus]
MRFSSAAGKSEQIKTHYRSFYTPNLKQHVMQRWGSTDKFRIPKMRSSEPSSDNRTPISLVKTGYRLPGHLPGLPCGQPQFRALPDYLLGDRPTVEHGVMST